MYIGGNRFYKCVGDVVLLDTSNAVPQDVVIEGNTFSGPAANTDCNLYLEGGSGINGVVINNNIFQQLPALGGTNDRFILADGCIGMMTNNTFGAITAEAETDKTFQAAGGSAATIPVTLHMANNWGENGPTAAAADGAAGEVYRTA